MQKALPLFCLSFTLLLASCNKDTVPPVITIKNNTEAYNRVQQFTSSYSDPGATAIDDNDGEVEVKASGTVNVNSAGEYIITYTARDRAGNESSAQRNVTVDGALYFAGTYTVKDFNHLDTLLNTFQDTINYMTEYNRIRFHRFRGYPKGNVTGNLVGTTIAIPQQNLICGTPPNFRTFSGNGSYSINFTSFRVNYVEVTNGTPASGYCIYTKN